MSVHYDPDRRRFVVRWRDDGRQRSKRFRLEADAEEFDEAMRVAAGRPGVELPEPVRRTNGDGVYAYATGAGVRYRFVFRQSDGTLSSRRGFSTRQAALAARREVMESVKRLEITVCREDFATFWARFVADKRPYVTAGSHLDLVTHGRKRLLPFFGADQLSSIDSGRVREWLAVMVELIEVGEISPKTVNNARTYLSMAFEEACRRGLIVRNPCSAVRALPVDRAEVEFLRLAEIGAYLDACSEPYRPLAEFLIGTGARISEAVATRWADVDLEEGVARIYRQRERTSSATRPTKGKRFRSVQMGPRLSETLRSLRLSRLSREIADDGWVFLCPPPRRGRHAGRTQPLPPHRRTAHEWHEAALQDAGLRDMPLHSLRHTAAASWLAVGHPLMFVMRQLGHRAITTTEEYYGHLEGSFVKGAAAMTEVAIIDARPLVRPSGTGEGERYSARRSD